MRKIGLSVVDLFAGCGGFGLGLEEHFTPIFVNELDSHARATYILNRKERFPWLAGEDERASFCSSDARGIVEDHTYLKRLQQRFQSEFGIKRGEISLLVGGPPCQGFSGIGHRRSYAVDKHALPSNRLFETMATIIRRLRPRAFVFENVRGLLTSRWTSTGESGEIWKAVKNEFVSIGGYTIAAQLVFAKNFGVAQNRPRVLLVGIEAGIVGPATTKRSLSEIDDSAIDLGLLPRGNPHAWPNLVDVLGDLVDPSYENGGATLRYPKHTNGSQVQAYFRRQNGGEGIAAKGDPLTEHEYSHHRAHVAARFQAMIDGEAHKRTKKFSQRVLSRKWSNVGPTITATSLPDDYVHFSQPRTLTVREWARLQGFPDWYQFMGKRTTGGLRRAGNPRMGSYERELPKYTQIGNAVPVPLAKAIGTHIARLLRR